MDAFLYCIMVNDTVPMSGHSVILFGHGDSGIVVNDFLPMAGHSISLCGHG